MAYAVKIFISAALILAASEIARRSAALGALIVSLPLTSMLAMVWLYRDTHDMQKLSDFAMATPGAVLPSLVFFFAFALLAKYNFGFAVTMTASACAMLICYAAYIYAMKLMGF